MLDVKNDYRNIYSVKASGNQRRTLIFKGRQAQMNAQNLQILKNK